LLLAAATPRCAAGAVGLLAALVLPVRLLLTVQCAGRANLIGEHTDYNDGFVFPFGIDKHIYLAFRPREDSVVRIFAADFDEEGEMVRRLLLLLAAILLLRRVLLLWVLLLLLPPPPLPPPLTAPLPHRIWPP